MPEVLSVKGNHIQIWEHFHGQWRDQYDDSIPGDKTINSTALACDSKYCYAALAYTQTESTDNLAVLRLNHTDWKAVAEVLLPNAATLGAIELAPAGSSVWMLASGEPALGLMPKQLWVSQDTGQKWALVATSDILPVSKGLSFPTGYPTGLVPITPHRVIVSMSPHGGDDVVAVQYQLHPSKATNFSFSIPAHFSYVNEAFPALKDTSITIPLLASNAHSTRLLWETLHSRTSWQAKLGPTISSNPTVSGYDTLVIVNNKTLKILSPQAPIITAPILPAFINPLVGALVAPRHMLALSLNGSLWENTLKGTWRIYHG